MAVPAEVADDFREDRYGIVGTYGGTLSMAATASMKARVFDAAVRGGLSALGGKGADARLSTLIFHRVLPEPDPLLPGEMHRQRFERLCGWLARWFNVLPLDDAVSRLRTGTLPARALAITFDDGYADNHDIAAPVLRRHGLSATFFVATGYLDGGRMFNDTVIETVRRTRHAVLDVSQLGLPGVARVSLKTVAERRQAIAELLAALKHRPLADRQEAVDELARIGDVALPTGLMMTREQLRALSLDMQIGAHTRNHPILASLSADDARAEIEDGKADLESIIDREVDLFAYPNGRPAADYNIDSVKAVRSAGFRAAFSTAWGAARRGGDFFQLPRFTPWDQSESAFALRSMRNLRWATP